MTDKERLREIHHETCAARPPAVSLARIRALLAEPLPTVEWMSSYPSRWDAHIGKWSFGISRKDDLFSAWVEHYAESIYAESGDILTLASAKRRAVALYAALRGVT